MSIIAWIVLGLISGFIGSQIVNHRGEGALLDVVLGVIGALLGGFIFNLLGLRGVTGFNLWSLIVAVIGSVTLLAISNGFRRRLA